MAWTSQPKIIQIVTFWNGLAETSGENSSASLFMRTSAEIRLAEDRELLDRMMLKDDCAHMLLQFSLRGLAYT